MTAFPARHDPTSRRARDAAAVRGRLAVAGSKRMRRNCGTGGVANSSAPALQDYRRALRTPPMSWLVS